ncbi:hypothetical protein CH379_010085 [Leptospira ellisii]|uniref:PEGA domain-containing protein n=2 Tax=Leptospira ellisii TaxID=2023197 RepID=A0A2N0B7H7_9LEPT|nr:hypothetical protein [Leptospira ellisii]MDV6235971.1 hypothetical protein [Leptospira ellisii]PJZ92463.1 hypothetical protein CH379_12970 [Leptospira ellisii]
MKKLSILLILGLVNCATIVSDNVYNYTIASDPVGATVEISMKGYAAPVAQITTPGAQALNLKNDYSLKFQLKGYKETVVDIRKDVDGWVWGNILIGGLIGLLIDYSTGSMYKPENGVSTVNVTLEKEPKPGKKAALEGNGIFARIQIVDQYRRSKVAMIPLEKGEGQVNYEFHKYIVKN